MVGKMASQVRLEETEKERERLEEIEKEIKSWFQPM